MICNYHR